jgi:hypothetical protein
MTVQRWRLASRAIHRDLGYFFTGVVLIYGVSGLAVNHVDHWDPDFVVERREVPLPLPRERARVSARELERALGAIEGVGSLQTFDFPTAGRVKVFLEEGTITSELGSGVGTYEAVRRRPVFYAVNRLHLKPGGWWLVFSDAFALGLIVVAVTGLVLARGRHGLGQRGKWLVAAGAIAPLAALLLS